nr:MAG TPA: hypothetical protein [Caudoviricetes sp.]DAY78700.1 MAG TPA: hypothetical protein [Caudoviricetes sp.]
MFLCGNINMMYVGGFFLILSPRKNCFCYF